MARVGPRSSAGRAASRLRPPARTAVWAAILALGLAGCAGYRLGPTGGRLAGLMSIQVQPFENKTLEPGLSDWVTDALRRRLQQDGTYRLDSRGEADVIVTGTIQRLDRTPIAFLPRDTLTPQQYHIRIVAHIVARERSTGRVLLDRQVSGRASLFTGADQSSQERQAIPLAADDLARTATSLIADGLW